MTEGNDDPGMNRKDTATTDFKPVTDPETGGVIVTGSAPDPKEVRWPKDGVGEPG